MTALLKDDISKPFWESEKIDVCHLSNVYTSQNVDLTFQNWVKIWRGTVNKTFYETSCLTLHCLILDGWLPKPTFIVQSQLLFCILLSTGIFTACCLKLYHLSKHNLLELKRGCHIVFKNAIYELRWVLEVLTFVDQNKMSTSKMFCNADEACINDICKRAFIA